MTHHLFGRSGSTMPDLPNRSTITQHRLARLRARIAVGSYPIDAVLIAEAMLVEHPSVSNG